MSIDVLKRIRIVLVMMMVVSAIGYGNPANIYAAESNSLTVSVSETTCKPGDEIVVNCSITSKEDFAYADFLFSAKDYFEIVSIIKSSEDFAVMSSRRGFIALKNEDALDTEELLGPGTYSFEIRLKVKEDTSAGEYNIFSKESKLIKNFWPEDELSDYDKMINASVTVDSDTITYKASLDSRIPAYKHVQPGETFTIDLVVTSGSVLSCGQFSVGVNTEVAKITGIENKLTGEAVSFESTVEDDGSAARISFFGNDESASNGLTVATITYEAVAYGTASIEMTEGLAAPSGNTADIEVTRPEEPTTVPVKIDSTLTYTDFGINYLLMNYTPSPDHWSNADDVYCTFGCKYVDGPEGEIKMFFKDGSWYGVFPKTWDGREIFQNMSAVDFEICFNADVTRSRENSQYNTYVKGDVNVNGKTNIVDAQIAYDLATQTCYEGVTAVQDLSLDNIQLTSEGILAADANNNMVLDALDARAIQVFIHSGVWGE